MRDIVVFGTGEVGKRIIPYLEEKFHILFWMDNDKKKWGTVFEGYQVKSPENILKYDCDVIIASTKFEFEILKQVRQMGIPADKIYFCRSFATDRTHRYEVYPIDENKVEVTKMSLDEYDLYHAKEQKTACKKVMICCSFFSVYPQQLIENMSGRYNDIEFSLLTNAKESKEKICAGNLKHIYYYQTISDLKSILEQLPVYDVIQLLWIEKEWAFFNELIREKARQLNLLIGGSDFYRAGKEERVFKRNIIMCANAILAVTEQVKQEFIDFYGESIRDKIIILHYGKEVLNYIRDMQDINTDLIKMKFGIPLNRFVVTCGYNAVEAQQHSQIIDALNQLPFDIKKRMVCVFPMTYPENKECYIEYIENQVRKTDIDYVILTKFMEFQEMAEYALISDSMIHAQITDLLSSSMIEQMYAGSIVIAGKWLPYTSLHDMGIFFLDIETIADISVMIEKVIMNIEEYKEKCKKNREIVWKNSSWDELAPRWYAIWGEDRRSN